MGALDQFSTKRVFGALAVAIITAAVAWFFWTGESKPPRTIKYDFPSKGYRMLDAPNADGGPGSVQGEDDQERFWPAAKVKVTVTPRPTAVPELAVMQSVSLGLPDLFAMFGKSPVHLSLGGDEREEFSFALINPQHVEISDQELQQPLLDAWPQPGKRLFDYKHYAVVQEAIMADGISLTVSRSSKLAAALSADSSLVATQPSTQPAKQIKLESGGNSDYKLTGTFPQPLFIFVKPHEVSDQRVAELRSVFAVSVSAETVTTSVQPGSVVTTGVHGPQVMVAQKNGPFGAVHSDTGRAEFILPPGATVVQAHADWTTNGKESGKSAPVVSQDGSKLVAAGTLNGNDNSWGPRTWGEVNLSVTYRLPDTSTRKLESATLATRQVVASDRFTQALPQPLPAHVMVNIEDVANGQPATAVPVDLSNAAPQYVLNGAFSIEVDREHAQLIVARKVK